jgi:hypothetical protein
MSGVLDFDTQASLAHRSARADSVLEKPLDLGPLFEEVVAWRHLPASSALG